MLFFTTKRLNPIAKINLINKALSLISLAETAFIQSAIVGSALFDWSG